MRAWRFDTFGDIANLTLGQWPDPEPGDDEVLIEMRYAALNPADRLLVEGRYPGAGELPLTVGRDGSGVVRSAPDDSDFSERDEVIVLRSEIGITRQGTLAELCVAPAAVVAPLPDGWSLQEGAAAPLVYLTAWKALVTQGGAQEGETVLVTGASGGVGIAAIQLARGLGMKVIALSRDEDTRAKLVELGADEALDSSADDLEDQIKDASDGGVDIVVDNLGGDYVQRYVDCANLNARIMVIGLLAGRTAELKLGPLLFKQVRIEGVHVGKYTPAQAQENWKGVLDALGKAKARPLIDTVFGFTEVQDAFAQLGSGHLGKVLVATTSEPE